MAHNINVGVSHNNLNTGQLILGVREDTNASSYSSDGAYHPLLFDTAGNLRVGIQYQAGVGVTGGNINIVSANNMLSITSTGLIGITSTVLGVNITTMSNLTTVSSVNSFIGINTASSMLSITSTGLIGITGPVLGVNISTISNLVVVSHTNAFIGINTASNVLSITSTGLLGVTQTGYWIVSATNPSVYSITATNRDGTFVVMPYTTETGYFSTAINIDTSASNKQIKHPGGLTIYITHIKASCLTPTNYWLVEDSTGTPIVKWDKTYLGNYGGENATLNIPLKLTAAKDLGLVACCTNFTLNIVGYVK